jgi:hypothetical protein
MFTPKVFKPGTYSIAVGEPGTGNWKKYANIESSVQAGKKTIRVEFDKK